MNLPWISTKDQLPEDTGTGKTIRLVGMFADGSWGAFVRLGFGCWTDNGTRIPIGQLTHWFAITPPAATAQVEMTCESCAGTGQTFHGENYELEKACITCFGTGKVRKEGQ